MLRSWTSAGSRRRLLQAATTVTSQVTTPSGEGAAAYVGTLQVCHRPCCNFGFKSSMLKLAQKAVWCRRDPGCRRIWGIENGAGCPWSGRRQCPCVISRDCGAFLIPRAHGLIKQQTPGYLAGYTHHRAVGERSLSVPGVLLLLPARMLLLLVLLLLLLSEVCFCSCRG